MIEGGVTAGILGSAITPTSVAPGGAQKVAAMGDITQPHGCCDVRAVFRWFVPTDIAAHTDRAKRSDITTPTTVADHTDRSGMDANLPIMLVDQTQSSAIVKLPRTDKGLKLWPIKQSESKACRTTAIAALRSIFGVTFNGHFPVRKGSTRSSKSSSCLTFAERWYEAGALICPSCELELNFEARSEIDALGRRLAADARPATMGLRSTIEGLKSWTTKLALPLAARLRRSVLSWKTFTPSFSRKLPTPSLPLSKPVPKCFGSLRICLRLMIRPRRSPQSMKDSPLFSMGFTIWSGFGLELKGVWKERIEANGFGSALTYDVSGVCRFVLERQSAALRRQRPDHAASACSGLIRPAACPFGCGIRSRASIGR
jgi:hypothetical protein